MRPQILGISGSPIKNSNTDRLVQAVLDSSGLRSEFVKLSKIHVRPCIGCLGCKKDNICKPKDDFQELAEKVRHSGALVVGGYSPYGAVDGFTKAFLERLFSLRHQNGLNRGKLAVVVTTGIGRGVPGLEEASAQIAHALSLEGMEVLGRLKAIGNSECMVCGFGDTCPMSALPWVFGEGTQVTPDMFCQVEDQRETWQQAKTLGLEIRARLQKQMLM
ncbi:Multimeric flavodoxin WrbA [Desulfacinum infernum DSM 9756]|uniref:Multimeric flavodoxin WrbA n=1 Tax=Desulfacinum infernum DSM 9756 TaxID=1121391 RepID=A0A1M4TD41_9BACT|nr:flavodoxin family protein [Desulfacinum infernum]SHE42360.1 Multimeric flavodoxin WrbA [Desulfacinum infernum DSM 9756]